MDSSLGGVIAALGRIEGLACVCRGCSEAYESRVRAAAGATAAAASSLRATWMRRMLQTESNVPLAFRTGLFSVPTALGRNVSLAEAAARDHDFAEARKSLLQAAEVAGTEDKEEEEEDITTSTTTTTTTNKQDDSSDISTSYNAQKADPTSKPTGIVGWMETTRGAIAGALDARQALARARAAHGDTASALQTALREAREAKARASALEARAADAELRAAESDAAREAAAAADADRRAAEADAEQIISSLRTRLAWFESHSSTSSSSSAAAVIEGGPSPSGTLPPSPSGKRGVGAPSVRASKLCSALSTATAQTANARAAHHRAASSSLPPLPSFPCASHQTVLPTGRTLPANNSRINFRNVLFHLRKARAKNIHPTSSTTSIDLQNPLSPMQVPPLPQTTPFLDEIRALLSS